MSDEQIVATYDLESFVDPRAAAETLAGEQSSGTFTAIAGETDELRRAHGAVILDVEELEPLTDTSALPGAWHPPDSDGRLRRARVRLGFPPANVGTSLTALTTMVAGNLFELRELAGVRLLDVEIPAQFGAAQPGPQFGVPGTRRLLGGRDGVLIGTIVKPSVGLGIGALRGVVSELAHAGIDFIKDDELYSDPLYAPIEQRIPAVLDEIDRAAQATGRRAMYAFNIMGEPDEMARRAELVADHGGMCVMIPVPVVGLSALQFVRRRCAVAIHGHRALFGAMTRSPQLGIAYIAYQKLMRLAGADHLHVGGVDSKFYESDESVLESIAAISQPLPGAAPGLPVLSSAQWAGTAPATWAGARTTDLLVLAGGGIIGHPSGPAAGVASMREAWAAAVDGQSLDERARDSPELREALDALGTR